MRSCLRHLKLGDLELFLTVATTKNISLAAQSHHMSQSTASSILMRLEQTLGLNLCVHKKRSFQLTPEGLAFLPKARAFFESAQLLLSPLHLPLRIATTRSMAARVFQILSPSLSIEFILKKPDEAYLAVLQDRADIALVPDNATWRKVELKVIGQSQFNLFAQDLHTPMRPILVPEQQLELSSFLHQAQDFYGYPLQIENTLSSWSLIAQICSNSSHVGFLPDFLAEQFSLQKVQWAPPSLTQRILLLYKHTDLHALSLCQKLLQEAW